MISFKGFLMNVGSFLLEKAIDADELHQKYYKSIERSAFDKLIEADPDTITKKGKIVRVGKALLNWWKKDEFDIAEFKKLYAKIKKNTSKIRSSTQI